MIRPICTGSPTHTALPSPSGTNDDQTWKVTAKNGGIYAAHDGRYLTIVAGVTWFLGRLDRVSTAYQPQQLCPLK